MENKENLLYQEKDDLSVKDIINNIKALFTFFQTPILEIIYSRFNRWWDRFLFCF
jgi:hypothetical protein